MYALVYRQMHALAGRAQDLDDLVQLAAEQVFKSLPNFEERCAPETWTYRVCYNTLMKQRRWYRRWLQRFAFTNEGHFNHQIDDTRLQSADLLEQRERAERMRQALSQVPPKRRAVVILHDLDELEIEEIAAIVGANVRTVRSRLRDGRRLLAQALERDPFFGDEACGQEAT
jgi:RNA polymerase sigma-70 factor (ECF subfamily)